LPAERLEDVAAAVAADEDVVAEVGNRQSRKPSLQPE